MSKTYGKRGRTAPTMAMSSMLDSGSDFSSSETDDNTNIFSRCPESEPDIPSTTSDYEVPKHEQQPSKDSAEAQHRHRHANRLPNAELSSFTVTSQDNNHDESIIYGGIEPSSDIQIEESSKDESPKRKLKKETPDLIAFDFLDAPKPNKRRRNTNYQKQKIIIDSEEENTDDVELPAETARVQDSMDKVLENVERFLNSLDAQGEHSINEIFEGNIEDLSRQVSSNQDISSGQRVYNAKRTLLLDKNKTEEDEEQDMINEYLDDIEDKENRNQIDKKQSDIKQRNHTSGGNNGSYNFNELKNIGKSLEYKEDFEYLTNGLTSSTPIDGTIIMMCEFILAISNDPEFKDYVQKVHSDEVCEWCLRREGCNSEELLLLQGYILGLFRFNYAILKNSTPIDATLKNLVKCKTIPEGEIFSNKLKRMTYNDFLKINDGKCGRTYAYEIWSNIVNDITDDNKVSISDSIVEDIASHIDQKGFPTILSFKLLEMMISTPVVLNHVTKPEEEHNHINVITSIINIRNIQNENYLKCLILLTKDHCTFTTIEPCRTNKLAELCILRILDYFENHPDSQSDDTTTLQLGLCMNLVECLDSQMKHTNSLWTRMEKALLYRTTNHTDQGLVLALTYLVFAYLTLLKEETSQLHERPLNFLENLVQIQKNCESVNEGVYNKLQVIIERLDDVPSR